MNEFIDLKTEERNNMNGIRGLNDGPKCTTTEASSSGRVVAMALANDVSTATCYNCVQRPGQFKPKTSELIHDHSLLQYPTSFSPPLPASFDWKKNMSPIKNQGMCASCWAFATTTVMEAFISIQFKKTPVALSSQALVDCYTEF